MLGQGQRASWVAGEAKWWWATVKWTNTPGSCRAERCRKQIVTIRTTLGQAIHNQLAVSRSDSLQQNQETHSREARTM